MIDYKYWYGVHEDMVKHTSSDLTDDTNFYGLKFQDYFIMNRVMYHTRPKHIGWIGGFSNLDFFVSQYGVDSIARCSNVDNTPASHWCKQKHEQYIKKYRYNGQYEFIEKKYDQSMLTDVDFLSTLSKPLKNIQFENFHKINTVVAYHYGFPRNINTVTRKLHSMSQRIITNDIVVYSTHDIEPVVEDCEFLSRIGKSKVEKIDGVTVVAKSWRPWEDIIAGLTKEN